MKTFATIIALAATSQAVQLNDINHVNDSEFTDYFNHWSVDAMKDNILTQLGEIRASTGGDMERLMEGFQLAASNVRDNEANHFLDLASYQSDM